jgi:hypothetical protein
MTAKEFRETEKAIYAMMVNILARVVNRPAR